LKESSPNTNKYALSTATGQFMRSPEATGIPDEAIFDGSETATALLALP
jgi:hypothetical protein